MFLSLSQHALGGKGRVRSRNKTDFRIYYSLQSPGCAWVGPVRASQSSLKWTLGEHPAQSRHQHRKMDHNKDDHDSKPERQDWRLIALKSTSGLHLRKMDSADLLLVYGMRRNKLKRKRFSGILQRSDERGKCGTLWVIVFEYRCYPSHESTSDIWGIVKEDDMKDAPSSETRRRQRRFGSR